MIKEPDIGDVIPNRSTCNQTVSTGEGQQEIGTQRKKRCIEKKVGDKRQRQRLSLALSHPPTYFVLKSGVSISTGQNKIMSAYRVFPLTANNFTLFYVT